MRSKLVHVLGDDPFINVVDTLMDHPSQNYTKKDLADVNDLSRQTIYNIWDRIERLNIVEESRKIGNTTLYSLNSDGQVVKAFYQFEEMLPDLEGDPGER